MATIIPVSPFDYVVFGATGDLTQRKLLPALYQRYRDAQIPETSRIIGASRSHMRLEEFREHARDALKSFVPPAEIDETKLAGFLDHLFYVAVDALGDEGWNELRPSSTSGPTGSGPIISPPRPISTARSAATSTVTD